MSVSIYLYVGYDQIHSSSGQAGAQPRQGPCIETANFHVVVLAVRLLLRARMLIAFGKARWVYLWASQRDSRKSHKKPQNRYSRFEPFRAPCLGSVNLTGIDFGC